MFLGFSGLVNQQAIALTKANAYTAAKVVLGLNAPMVQLLKAASDYTAYAIPRLNRAATVPQILSDLKFAEIASQAKDSTTGSVSDKIAKAEKAVSGSLALGDAPLGVPNWLLYAGAAAGGYFLYKKKKASGWKFFSKPSGASVVPSVGA